MEQNVGGMDRIGRFVIGAGLLLVSLAGFAGAVDLALGPLTGGVVAGLAALVGLVLVVTGALRTCPLNALFGLNTARRS